MSNNVYNEAVKWLKKYKKSHDVSAADEQYYWEQVLKHCDSGTTAYTKAMNQLVKSVASSVSGLSSIKLASDSSSYYSDIYDAAEEYMTKLQIVSDVSLDQQLAYWKSVRSQLKKGTDAWYDATAQIKEIQESYYDEIYSDAEDYANKMDTMNSWSLNDQLSYWQSVQKQLKAGTDAWYDAQSQINSIKQKIGTVSNASSLLSVYQTYFNMSEKAEMQYWDAVRKQYAVGTDERLEADQEYLDAKEAYYEKLEELEEEYADAVKDIEEDLADNIDDLTESYNDSLQDRIDTIRDAYNLFDEFTSESSDGKTLLFNLQSQAAGYEAWSDALDALEDRGILSEDLLEELTEMGPDQLAAIYALSDLTDEELTAYNEAYQKKMDAATKQAEEDTADLKAEMETQTAELKAQAEKDKAELLAQYQSDTASVNTTITSELLTLANSVKTIAEDQTTALVTALKNQSAKDGVSTASASSSSSSSSAKSSSSSGNSSGSSSGSSASTTKSSGSTSSADTTAAAQQTELETRDKILKIIASGPVVKKLTAAQRKSHHDLYLYLVDNYGYGGNKSVYTKLAKQLGVTVSATPTNAQKTKILKKLKAKGFRSGGRNLEDELIWMDEELDTKGSELIVRKADNAIMTRAKPGDDIIDANTTSNLLRLGKVNPDDLMDALANQQEVALACLEEINSAGTAAQLNQLAATATAAPPAGYAELKQLGEKMDSMESLMSQFLPYLPYLEQRQQVVISADEVVDKTKYKMSREFAAMSRRR